MCRSGFDENASGLIDQPPSNGAWVLTWISRYQLTEDVNTCPIEGSVTFLASRPIERMHGMKVGTGTTMSARGSGALPDPIPLNKKGKRPIKFDDTKTCQVRYDDPLFMPFNPCKIVGRS